MEQNQAPFPEMSIQDLVDTLSLTIKHDDMNKVILFLAMLTTYTAEDQMNISLNARSSSGKTYLVQEIAKFFPEEDINEFGKVSPTAFYYDDNSVEIDKDGSMVLNLEKKILIFLDQVDSQLQANLRSLLSHDKKKLPFKITGKNYRGNNSARTNYILGYPTTFFCSAAMRMDEQEQTRSLILSPETSEAKISDSLDLIQEKLGDRASFQQQLDENTERQQLIKRVRFVKEQNVRYIIVPGGEYIASVFKTHLSKLQPRNQRDICHFNSLIKAHALLNVATREHQNKKDIVANEKDLGAALKLWQYIYRSQQYGISPQALDFYEQFVVKAYKKVHEHSMELTLTRLSKYYFEATETMLNSDYCRKQILPTLEEAGLISINKSPTDKRHKIITPTML